jgi:hypothetical protein
MKWCPSKTIEYPLRVQSIEHRRDEKREEQGRTVDPGFHVMRNAGTDKPLSRIFVDFSRIPISSTLDPALSSIHLTFV